MSRVEATRSLKETFTFKLTFTFNQMNLGAALLWTLDGTQMGYVRSYMDMVAG